MIKSKYWLDVEPYFIPAEHIVHTVAPPSEYRPKEQGNMLLVVLQNAPEGQREHLTSLGPIE